MLCLGSWPVNYTDADLSNVKMLLGSTLLSDYVRLLRRQAVYLSTTQYVTIIDIVAILLQHPNDHTPVSAASTLKGSRDNVLYARMRWNLYC